MCFDKPMAKLMRIEICVTVIVATVAGQAAAHVPEVVAPSHLSVGAQQFDLSVTSLRDYLETLKETDANLYRQLDPLLARLETQRRTALVVAAAGAALGVASLVYALAGQKDCPLPDATDPQFAAKSAAWGSCTHDNTTTGAMFGLAGVAAIGVGLLAGVVIAPGRGDLLAFVNQHNRLSAEPLRLQLGYDPTHGLAYAGAGLTF